MTPVRRSTVFLWLLLASGLVLGGLLFIHPRLVNGHHARDLAKRRKLVSELRLTDLCLFTEARYTRNPSQADLHSAFQDHPMAFEHFPSGSVVPPSRRLMER